MFYNQVVKRLTQCGMGLIVTLLMMSCATTQLASSWKDPGYNLGPLKKVAVFAVHEDPTVRRAAEDRVVAHIPAGTQAVASYSLFEKLEREDRGKIKARLIDEGFDGALVIRLVSLRKNETYVPPQTFIIPGDPHYGGVPYYNTFDDYYGYVHGQVYIAPAYMRVDTIAKIETVLYTLPDSKMVWSAISKSVNPQSAEKVAHELAELITNELVGHDIVGSGGDTR